MLKFWGTRGSCAVSGPEYRRFGGNTICVEMQYQDTHFIIDAGTGIRPLGLTLIHENKFDLFLTHFHWDHILGFPFFEPLYREGVEITIWAPHGDARDPREIFDDLLKKEFFPVQLDQVKAKLSFKILKEKNPIQLGPIILDSYKTDHTTLTYSFKIKTPHQTIGYVSDNEVHIESQKGFIEFHKGCDIFIHEAQYSTNEYKDKEGWGHTSLSNGARLIREIKPGKWLVIHHDPEHTDAQLLTFEKMERENHLPCPVEWIGDGYVLNLD